jgi:hypothetical protein
LFTTTIGWSISLYLVMIDWIMRVKLSVPPPGEDVTTNSIGLAGCHASAADAVSVTKALATRVATFIVSSSALPRAWTKIRRLMRPMPNR